MMRKKIVSLCMALVLCLGLLPATTLAAGEDAPAKLYVGDQQVIVAETVTYWSTNDSGGLTRVENATDNSANWSVRYNPTNATLTLNEAKISGSYDQYNNPFTAGIYAKGSSNQPVALTIELIGTNTITGDYGIYVDAQQGETVGTNASLLIRNSSDNGILEVSGSFHGIYVKSGTGNASLTIKDASVVASSSSSYDDYAGVCVHSGIDATSSPKLSLAVDGGSLTTSASEGNDGIQFYVGSSEATGATSLTVSDNAIVDARNGGISASRILETLPTPTPTGNNSSGIVFDGSTGTVYGSVTLQDDLEIKSGETLTIPEGSSLTSNDKLTNNGTVTIENGGTLTDADKVTNNGTINVEDGGKLEGTPTGGTVVKAPTITTQPADMTVTEGQTASFTVTATGENPTYQWAQSTDQGKNWTEISGATGSTYTTVATTTSMSGYQYHCVVSNSAGSVTSNAVTLTVNAATVPVTGVSLTPASLSLFTGDTATLTATVQPSNATNQNVTWSSDKPEVATVENGKVTAKAAGTATITVTTENGNKTATCTVTVTRPYIPPANPNYRVDVTTTAGGTVTKDPAAAKAGETVTLTPAPDAGYEVVDVTVTDRFGDAVEVTEQADGTYTFTMPNGQVSVNVTFVEVQTEPLPFTDVSETDWFHDAVQYVYDNGLMGGVGDNRFAPNNPTTRAQLVTILYRLEGEPAVTGQSAFTDVEADTWYTNAVAWAAANGIVNGVSETQFAPGNNITREQLATILYRYAQAKGYDVSASADLSGFPDAGDIQSYATQALSWAVAEGLLQGFEDDTLRPQGNATRAQIATILMRFLSAAPTA